MSAPLNLSVVVPLYNEEESLPHLVEQLLSALRPTDEAFELVLVEINISQLFYFSNWDKKIVKKWGYLGSYNRCNHFSIFSCRQTGIWWN